MTHKMGSEFKVAQIISELVHCIFYYICNILFIAIQHATSFEQRDNEQIG